MTLTGKMPLVSPLDPYLLREDFPLLKERSEAYLDSAASAQKPEIVLRSMDDFYRRHYANVHRSVYALAEEATAAYEGARERVARFLTAEGEDVIFTRSATSALNLVASSYERGPGAALGPKDVIVVTELEHHSNLVPWLELARRSGAQMHAIPVDDQGELDLSALDAIARQGNVRLLAYGLISNVLGTINPARELSRWAREQGAYVVIDAAQAAPHQPLDVQRLDCDFLAMTAHKLGGPTGIGALWGRRALLEEWPPYEYGGHMISKVTLEGATWAHPPGKFEAGTPPIAEAVGFAAALDYLEGIGLERVHPHERILLEHALARLEPLDVILYGPAAERRAGIVSFSVPGVHPHDVAQILGYQGVCIRAGHHCAQPLMQRLGVQATNRASFWLYTTLEDVDRLADGLAEVRRIFGA
jgi:cysteine desulfurase/selenocysteine lyase